MSHYLQTAFFYEIFPSELKSYSRKPYLNTWHKSNSWFWSLQALWATMCLLKERFCQWLEFVLENTTRQRYLYYRYLCLVVFSKLDSIDVSMQVICLWICSHTTGMCGVYRQCWRAKTNCKQWQMSSRRYQPFLSQELTQSLQKPRVVPPNSIIRDRSLQRSEGTRIQSSARIASKKNRPQFQGSIVGPRPQG